jgi:hypothetical protein
LVFNSDSEEQSTFNVSDIKCTEHSADTVEKIKDGVIEKAIKGYSNLVQCF